MGNREILILICSFGLTIPLCAQAQQNPNISEAGPMSAENRPVGERDFDFEIGVWKTHISRRLKPLTGSTTWVEYEGKTVVRPLLNGRANIAELTVEGPAGRIEGVSLRLYEPQSRQWTLNYASLADGALTPPVIGSFNNGRGAFYAKDSLEGRAIIVRFVISDITANSARFEQAFSADDGKTWEVNWIATDTRVKDRL